MSYAQQVLSRIQGGQLDDTLAALYGPDNVMSQRTRYMEAVSAFAALFGEDRELYLFSAPGRTEIGGNHTDHNHGCVLAGAVDLDVIAVVAKNPQPVVRVQSEGYPLDTVDITDTSIHPEEVNRSASLIRGTAARFTQLGLAVGGFDAYTTSNVLKGSGLSSSAAFEVLLGTIFNHLYNGGAISPVEIAKISQYAENVYFGKPSGLMDQMASSVGGIVHIDFEDNDRPLIRQIEVDFSRFGVEICLVDTGGDHADLTHEYTAIPQEMKAVAEQLGAQVLRQVDKQTLLENLPALRQSCGDRAVLRALHFMEENERATSQAQALKAGDFDRFLQLVLASGHSSFEYLQNVYVGGQSRCQGLSLALCLAQQVLAGKGAWRVHGGGFGGTTQNFVPQELVPAFIQAMEPVFGQGCCHVLRIRPVGGVRVL